MLYNSIMKKEVWKSIPGYEGRYYVSNLGRVKGPLKILKPTISNWGYERVRITNNAGKRTTPRVHRLVAQVFIPNPENKPEVNHIDGNKLNNNVSNLEWVTASENKLHDICQLGTKPWNMGSKKCRCIETGKEYHSVHYASISTGIPRTSLQEHLKGNRTHASGYHWEYVE